MNVGQLGLSQVGPGQVDLVRSLPGPILSLVLACRWQSIYLFILHHPLAGITCRCTSVRC